MCGGQRGTDKFKYRAVCTVCHFSPVGKRNASTIDHLTTPSSHESLLENRAAGFVNPPLCLQGKDASLYKKLRLEHSWCRCKQAFSVFSPHSGFHTNSENQPCSQKVINIRTHLIFLIFLNGLPPWTKCWMCWMFCRLADWWKLQCSSLSGRKPILKWLLGDSIPSTTCWYCGNGRWKSWS